MPVGQKIKARLNKHFGNVLVKVIEADNRYTFKGISLRVPPGIFHPRYFTSSKMLLSFVEETNLENKSVLELGCGSGITSIAAHLKGAQVTASDISKQVVETLRSNLKKNNLDFKVIHSDLFDSLPNVPFDYVLINPPFYPRNPVEEKEYAWYCGENFEYFEKLFQQLNDRQMIDNIFLTLSSDCNLEMIDQIAGRLGYKLEKIWSKASLSESNTLYELVNTRL